MTKKINLAVLLSGGGTTLQNILDKISEGTLPAKVVCVVSSRSDAYGLERAQKYNIPRTIIRRKNFKDTRSLSDEIFRYIEKFPVDLMVLAGFMVKINVPSKWFGKIMNIHPALIPSFCGEGLYGEYVHKAVIDAGVKVTGCTIHFVDDIYDHGPIIVQKAVKVDDSDTPDTLKKKVLKKEYEAYPEAIRLFAEGRLKIEGNRVKIL